MPNVSCPYCKSPDTDRPYSRSSRIFILSHVFQRLRMWYCRACGRHFPTILPRERHTPAD
jgi:transposase-like protein